MSGSVFQHYTLAGSNSLVGPPPGPPPGGGGAPTVFAWYTPTSGPWGTVYTVFWNSTDATSVSYVTTGAWNSSGTFPTVNGSASATLTFEGVATTTFTATGPGGTATFVATLTGTTQEPPTITAWYTPSSGPWGTAYTVHWTTTNATSVSYAVTGAWNSSGTFPTVNGSASNVISFFGVATTTFTAVGPGGTATTVATLTGTTPEPPTVFAWYAPASGAYGSPYTVYWSSSNATSVSYVTTGAWNSSGTFPATNGNASSTIDFYGTATTTFTAVGPGGSVQFVATLTGV